MAEYYSFIYDSMNGDRKWAAKEFAKNQKVLLSNGVFPNPSQGFQILALANEMSVTVGFEDEKREGLALVEGHPFSMRGIETFSVPAADTMYGRYDTIVIRHSNYISERKTSLVYRQGTPAASPLVPALERNDDVYELRVGYIYVRANAVRITQADVYDTRLNSEECGIVYCYGNTVDTSTIFNQYMTYLQQVAAEWTGQKEQQAEDWQEQTVGQQADWETQTNQQKLIFDQWFAQAVADPANYFQRNFDNPSMYPGCSLFTEAVSKTLTVQEIRTGTEESGALIASRHITKTGIGENTEIDYSFYNIDGEVIFRCTEHYERISNKKTKNYVEAVVV